MEVLVQQIVNGLVVGAAYILVATGFSLVFGVLDVPNLAHGELLMLGAYFTLTLLTAFGAASVPFPLAVLVASMGVGLVGILLNRGVFGRIKEHAPQLVAALAVSLGLQQIALFIWTSRPTRIPLTLPGNLVTDWFVVSYPRILIMAVAAITTGLLYLFLMRTRTGRGIRAMSENVDAARLMGVNTSLTGDITFFIGAAMAGLAGTLLAIILPLFPQMGGLPLLKAFAIVVASGVGNIAGAVVGGLVLGVLEALLAGYVSSVARDALAFLVIVVVLAVRPQGLLGGRE